MTHIAWVPERWVEAATGTLAGLAERHPSRTILLFPRPDDPRTRSRARSTSAASCAAASSARSARRWSRSACAGGARRRRRASSCRSSSPTCRSSCAGAARCPSARSELEQLVGVADRLVVDSREWPERASRSRPPAGALRPDRRLRHLLGAHGALARRASRASGRRSPRPRTLRVAGPGARGAAPRRLARARASAARSARARAGRARSSSSRWTAARPADPPRLEPRRRATSSPTSSTSSAATAIFEEAVRSFSSQPT